MMRGIVRYLRRNPSLALGTVLLVALALFVVIGGMLVDIEDARPYRRRPCARPHGTIRSAPTGKAATSSR